MAAKTAILDKVSIRVVSTYYIACFVGNSLPVIGVGVLSTLTDPLIASVAFACTVGLLSLAALAWQHHSGRFTHPGQEAEGLLAAEESDSSGVRVRSAGSR